MYIHVFFMPDVAHVASDDISKCLGFRVHTSFLMFAAGDISAENTSTCLRLRPYTKYLMFPASISLHMLPQTTFSCLLPFCC